MAGRIDRRILMGFAEQEPAMVRWIFALLALAAGILPSAEVPAQSRPFSPALACPQAQRLVLTRGGVVIGTGRHTYDRDVRDRGFCEWNEYIEPAYVPTADTPQCSVGYICTQRPAWFFGDD